jgi:hypothetical protein
MTTPRLSLYGAHTTLYSAAVASPAAARSACECGLAAISMNVNLQLIAGLYADMQTMVALRELGMPLSETVIKATALSGRLHILQHLLSEQHCPKPYALSYYAARSGSIITLKWMRKESFKFSQYTCTGAAEEGQLAALQHLRNEGCDWDADRIACSEASSGSIELVEWLRHQQGIAFNAETHGLHFMVKLLCVDTYAT